MNEPGPDLVIVGAMKAGTTSLHRYLREHPQILMAAGKELHFFSAAEHWDQGDNLTMLQQLGTA